MGKNESVDVSEGEVKRSISLRLVRHSESFNNQASTCKSIYCATYKCPTNSVLCPVFTGLHQCQIHLQRWDARI